MKIKYVKVSEIKTYPQNAKIHTGEQIEQIKKSIKEYGFNDPIAIWRNGEIIEGHGRYIAAVELGYEEVPVIELTELTDEERRAYSLVHNQLTTSTGFDTDVLAEELAEINQYDMEYFGFQLQNDFDTSEFYENDDRNDIIEVVCENCGHKFHVDRKGNVIE